MKLWRLLYLQPVVSRTACRQRGAPRRPYLGGLLPGRALAEVKWKAALFQSAFLRYLTQFHKHLFMFSPCISFVDCHGPALYLLESDKFVSARYILKILTQCVPFRCTFPEFDVCVGVQCTVPPLPHLALCSLDQSTEQAGLPCLVMLSR